jgi:hypothetical protein
MFLPWWMVLLGVLVCCGGPYLLMGLLGGAIARGRHSMQDPPAGLNLRDGPPDERRRS